MLLPAVKENPVPLAFCVHPSYPTQTACRTSTSLGNAISPSRPGPARSGDGLLLTAYFNGLRCSYQPDMAEAPRRYSSTLIARSLKFFSADFVRHAATPNGCEPSTSQRTLTLRSVMVTSTNDSSSIHAWIFASVTRTRI